MIVVLLLVVIICIITLSSRKENFNCSGYKKTVGPVTFDDTGMDMKKYKEQEDAIDITPDLMEKMILATNKYIKEKTDMCTYIIETTRIKKFKSLTSSHVLYKCMFMVAKQEGFSFGFSITAEIIVNGDDVIVHAVQSKPIDINPPTNVSPYLNDVPVMEHVPFNEIRKSELESIKY
jgi:hypothetical protein|tara:strand:- start:3382 stop:3912 length:531 start_codon:yes stop_codon:yes gene_type:complete